MLLLYCRTIAPIVVYVYISLFFYYDIRVLVISKITTEVSDQLALTALRYDNYNYDVALIYVFMHNLNAFTSFLYT